MKRSLVVKKATIKDIAQAAVIASQSFSGLKKLANAKKWIICNFRAYPRIQYFVAKQNNEVIGYIVWLEKSGFREQAVFELEQIAVAEKSRGKGIGKMLIIKSLEEIKKQLKKRKSTLKIVEVTTASTNYAQELYKKVLGANVEGVIKDFLRGDEVIMIARNV